MYYINELSFYRQYDNSNNLDSEAWMWPWLKFLLKNGTIKEFNIRVQLRPTNQIQSKDELGLTNVLMVLVKIDSGLCSRTQSEYFFFFFCQKMKRHNFYRHNISFFYFYFYFFVWKAIYVGFVALEEKDSCFYSNFVRQHNPFILLVCYSVLSYFYLFKEPVLLRNK